MSFALTAFIVPDTGHAAEAVPRAASAGLCSDCNRVEPPSGEAPSCLSTVVVYVCVEPPSIQGEVFSALLPPMLAAHPASSAVLHQLWPLNREAMLRALVDIHSADPAAMVQIMYVCADLKACIPSIICLLVRSHILRSSLCLIVAVSYYNTLLHTAFVSLMPPLPTGNRC